ncbi:protein translocase subunit SecD [bacterium]|jgi:preprotein translocase subunit SecD|nr:protein translocase subunit SecD [bacterium]MBT3730227.1 protein translocase subunit SecD [bacterium]MBT4894662.1 protein translocase subunit SecD [bacterium]
MFKVRIITLVILVAAAGVGYFSYSSEINEESRFQFKLGLDLAGGTHLVYKADTSELPASDVSTSMDTLRDVIERRTNLFGVSEPMVQIEKSSVFAGGEREQRLIVELPGVTDISEAVRIIGETPLLEFRLVNQDVEPLAEGEELTQEIFDAMFTSTDLTGRYLDRAALEFGQGGTSGHVQNEPIVRLDFNRDGGDLFASITKENVGRTLAIFLDGDLKSAPVINEEITGGSAIVSGGFTPQEARDLVRNLNLGALPVPIELISTQTIGASLGKDALDKGVQAGMFGLIAVAIFLLVWYRLPGLVAVISLTVYIIIMLALFKLIPVTLTAAGLAGFLLSIGMAVDANVLIFERMREELKAGSDTESSTHNGFKRAWLSIRDGNISSIITAIILFWFGTSLVKGFALTFGIGIIISMFTAITVSRTFLYAFGKLENRGVIKFLFGSGIK